MTFAYVSVEEAIGRRGLRMVVVGDVPSPWGEAAKGILHIKGIEWVAVRLAYDSEPLKQWAGQRSGPVRDLRRTNGPAPAGPKFCCSPNGWRRAAAHPGRRGRAGAGFGLAHEICGEGGLGWSRRLQLVHAGLNDAAAFPNASPNIWPRSTATAPRRAPPPAPRVAELLRMLAARLKAQQRREAATTSAIPSTAVDVYSATFTAMFGPLPPEQCADGRRAPARRSRCAMRRSTRRSTRSFSSTGDMMYARAPGAAALALIDGDARDAR